MKNASYVLGEIQNDKEIKKILPILKEQKTWLVGGYIRDLFLGLKSYDRDIVCLDDSCSLAKKIAKELDGTFIELDTENEIYRVVLRDKENYFDVSQALNGDINLDAKRRDFTLNSIFYSYNDEVFFDPYSGIADLEKNILRCSDINNFADDPLRMLRVFRFMALYGFGAGDDIYNFIKNNHALVNSCARERINQELIKLFSGKYCAEGLICADECGLLSEIFPFVDEIKKIPPNTHHHLDLFHHSIETMRTIRLDNALLKLAAFCHDIGKPQTHTIEPSGRHRFIGHDDVGSKLIKPILKDLKFSKKQIDYVSLMIKNHIYPSALMSAKDVQEKAKVRFVRKLYPYVEDIIELARADRLSARGPQVSDEMVNENLNNLAELLNFYYKIKPTLVSMPKLLDGKEIMEILNIKPSPVLGEIVDVLKEAQLEGVVCDKEGAKEFVLDYFKTYCKEM